ncbi:hypothetical protein ACEN8I_08840 [Polaromonas sp. CT11-55]|uniref:hypothetical protein n=1 Tax=Polaromonas sp. CT11-55 TaxID=3243045 RepID=UPI0039A68CD5
MPRHSSPRLIAITLLAAAGMFACIWLFIAVGYWQKGVSADTMLLLQISRETPEWQASRWAIAFPLVAVGLAAVYRWSPLAKVRSGAALLAAVAACIWAAGFNLVHPVLMFASAVPVVLAVHHFIVAVRANTRAGVEETSSEA